MCCFSSSKDLREDQGYLADHPGAMAISHAQVIFAYFFL